MVDRTNTFWDTYSVHKIMSNVLRDKNQEFENQDHYQT